MPPNPDLQVFSIDNAPRPPTPAARSRSTSPSSTRGPSRPRGHWTDNVYLSLKDHFDGSAIFLGSFGNQSALMPGEKYQTHTSDLPVPKRFGGPAYLIV